MSRTRTYNSAINKGSKNLLEVYLKNGILVFLNLEYLLTENNVLNFLKGNWQNLIQNKSLSWGLDCMLVVLFDNRKD